MKDEVKWKAHAFIARSLREGLRYWFPANVGDAKQRRRFERIVRGVIKRSSRQANKAKEKV